MTRSEVLRGLVVEALSEPLVVLCDSRAEASTLRYALLRARLRVEGGEEISVGVDGPSVRLRRRAEQKPLLVKRDI